MDWTQIILALIAGIPAALTAAATLLKQIQQGRALRRQIAKHASAIKAQNAAQTEQLAAIEGKADAAAAASAETKQTATAAADEIKASLSGLEGLTAAIAALERAKTERGEGK